MSRTVTTALLALLLALALLPACQSSSSSGGDDDTDTGTGSDADTDVDTDSDTGIGYDGGCEEDELHLDDAEFFAFCVPLDDQACIEAVSAIIESADNFDDICHEGNTNWLECDPEAEYYCMTNGTSGYTIEMLCELTLLQCIVGIYGGVYV